VVVVVASATAGLVVGIGGAVEVVVASASGGDVLVAPGTETSVVVVIGDAVVDWVLAGLVVVVLVLAGLVVVVVRAAVVVVRGVAVVVVRGVVVVVRGLVVVVVLITVNRAEAVSRQSPCGETSRQAMSSCVPAGGAPIGTSTTNVPSRATSTVTISSSGATLSRWSPTVPG
jgi:hypothetical protein